MELVETTKEGVLRLLDAGYKPVGYASVPGVKVAEKQTFLKALYTRLLKGQKDGLFEQMAADGIQLTDTQISEIQSIKRDEHAKRIALALSHEATYDRYIMYSDRIGRENVHISKELYLFAKNEISNNRQHRPAAAPLGTSKIN